LRVLYLHNEPYDSVKANLVQVKSMCKAMSENGLDVTLSIPAGDLGIACKTNSNKYKLITRDSVFDNSRIDKYVNIAGIRRSVKESNPDVIIVRSPLLLRQSVSHNVPLILELHDSILHQGIKPLHSYWKNYIKKLSRKDQLLKIVCISNALANYWKEQGIPGEKIIIAHDGFDEEQFHLQPDMHESRQNLGLPVDKKIITYLGSLYADRKVNHVLHLAEKYPECLFLVIGGPFRESQKLISIARDKGLSHVIITGHIPHENVAAYLNASDILLALWSTKVPTINYCSPLKLFEYMASGKLIVAHGFPTILEVLRDGENGIIAEPDSLSDLVEKVGFAIQGNGLEVLGKQARNDAFANYTWKKRVSTIFDGIDHGHSNY